MSERDLDYLRATIAIAVAWLALKHTVILLSIVGR